MKVRNIFNWLEGTDLQEMLIYSAVAGLATALGAGIVLVLGTPSKRVLSLFLGFAAGIMLAIATLELLHHTREMGQTVKGIIGFLCGVLFMHLLDYLIPHLHFRNGSCDQEQAEMLKVGFLIFLGIAVHNVAEGLAIGAGAIAWPELGLSIAVAIGIHNIPEGMATAVPLRIGGMAWAPLLFMAAAAGLMTVAGTAIGGLVFQAGAGTIAGALGFAAGAMFYIVGDELIPHARNYHHYWANIGLVGGFVLGALM